MSLGNTESLRHFIPELILTVSALATFLLGGKKDRHAGLAAGLTLLALAVGFAFTAAEFRDPVSTDLFERNLRLDSFTLFFKLVALLSVGLTVVLSIHCRELDGSRKVEYYALLQVVAVALCVLPAAIDFLTIYLAFEFVSLISYILAGFVYRNRASGEAALKYVLYGAAASGTMIFGMSFLYAAGGTLKLPDVAHLLAEGGVARLPLVVALSLILAGMGFKIAVVPFHMWSPDVYQGAPTPITALLSVGPKAAGFALLMRFFLTGFPVDSIAGQTVDWRSLIAILSALSMTVGNIVAIQQTNLKRLLAYSSIAHAGYLLMGVTVANQEGTTAVLFYFVVYMIMNVGAFLAVMVVGNVRGSMTLDSLKGLGWTSSGAFLSVALVVFLFALTGLPPTGGFIGKVYLFAAALHEGLVWLVILAVVNTVISLVYYAKIVKALFLSEPDSPVHVTMSSLQRGTLIVLLFLTLGLGVYWQPLIRWVQSVAMVI